MWKTVGKRVFLSKNEQNSHTIIAGVVVTRRVANDKVLASEQRYEILAFFQQLFLGVKRAFVAGAGFDRHAQHQAALPVVQTEKIQRLIPAQSSFHSFHERCIAIGQESDACHVADQ